MSRKPPMTPIRRIALFPVVLVLLVILFIIGDTARYVFGTSRRRGGLFLELIGVIERK